MLVRRNLGLLVVGSALGFAFMTACSGSSKKTTSSSTDKPDKSCTDTGVTCDHPPADPGGPAAAGTTPTVLAISKLYLGDTDKQGNPDPNAWKSLGYDIDGIVSTPHGTNHCKPVDGANPTNVKTDGNNGIDNSFGENLLPLITSLAQDVSASVNQSISDGSFTVMVKMDNVDSQANQDGITAALYGGAKMGSAPVWDGTDKWPVVPELLNGGNINDPKVQFAKSFVADNTWVSGSQGDLALNLAVQGYNLTLNIGKAVITMKLAGDRKSASGGIIAGVINTEDLVSQLKKVAGSFDPSLCDGPTFESIAQQIRVASDIMSNGTNGDPSKTCDAISIGIGFDAQQVQLGDVAPVSPPGADPCNPSGGAGGTGGTGGAGGAAGGAGGAAGGAGGAAGGAGGAADAGI